MLNDQQGRQTQALGLQEGLAEAHIKNNQAPKSFYKLSLGVRVSAYVCVGFSCSLALRSTTMQQLQLGRKLEMATWWPCTKKDGTRRQLQLPCKANRCNGLHFRATAATPLFRSLSLSPALSAALLNEIYALAVCLDLPNTSDFRFRLWIARASKQRVKALGCRVIWLFSRLIFELTDEHFGTANSREHRARGIWGT